MKVRKIIVAAGVLIRSDHSFLIAKRPIGKKQQGFWEFPGGKLEPKESLSDALKRELCEEIGIVVNECSPWLKIVNKYNDVEVHINFFKVWSWFGKVIPKEGQDIKWIMKDEILNIKFLPGNEKIIKYLNFPLIYGITPEIKDIDFFLKLLEKKLHKGLRLLQIRQKNANDQKIKFLIKKIKFACEKFNVKILLNDNVNMAKEYELDGVHFSSKTLQSLKKKPNSILCAASCHNLKEMELAKNLDIDFMVLGPVLKTLSHPNRDNLGWYKFKNLLNENSIPVYAIGGMNLNLLEIALKNKGHGIAMISNMWKT